MRGNELVFEEILCQFIRDDWLKYFAAGAGKSNGTIVRRVRRRTFLNFGIIVEVFHSIGRVWRSIKERKRWARGNCMVGAVWWKKMGGRPSGLIILSLVAEAPPDSWPRFALSHFFNSRDNALPMVCNNLQTLGFNGLNKKSNIDIWPHISLLIFAPCEALF